MNLAIKEQAEAVKLPIAKIKFKLDACVFRKKGSDYERIENTYITRNTMHEVVEMIDNHIFLLSSGEIVQSLPNNPAILMYGKLLIQKNGVKVYSRNGLHLRNVSIGQSFNVYAIRESSSRSTVMYKINHKEWILSQKGVEFVKGYFKPLEAYTVVNKGTPILFNPSESYAFSETNGSKIRLNGFDDLWIDVNVYKGKLESY